MTTRESRSAGHFAETAIGASGLGSRLDGRPPVGSFERQPWAGQSVTARKSPQVVCPLKLQAVVGLTCEQ